MACVSAEDDRGGVLRETKDTPPAHYVIKVQSFSLFSTNGVHQIKSNSFQVGDYQWKIILFPKGKNGGKDDHVSVYLMLDSTSSLSAGKGVIAFFKFFLLDQIRGNYLSVQGRASRFGSSGQGQGWSSFIELKDLKDDKNGYIVADQCIIEAEVTVLCQVYVDSDNSPGCELKTEFTLTLKDQFDQNHIQKKATIWFNASTEDWGWHSLIELKDLKDSTKGYLVEDRCIFEAEVTLLCETYQKTPNSTDFTSSNSRTSLGSNN